MARPVKLIAGVPHRQVRCSRCKELVWMPVKHENKDGIICGTCLTEDRGTTDNIGTGGGRWVHRNNKSYH